MSNPMLSMTRSQLGGQTKLLLLSAWGTADEDGPPLLLSAWGTADEDGPPVSKT